MARNSDALSHKAYEHIQRSILSGKLSGGSSISEVALAKEIGISRTPVREAVGRLISEGLLEHEPGRGTFVPKPDRRDLIELYELREAIESYAVARVAEFGLTPDLETRLNGLCGEFETLASELEAAGARGLDTPGRMRRFLAADMAFHMVLIRAAGNRRIAKVINDMQVLLRVFAYNRIEHSPSLLRSIRDHHREILEAVNSRDTVAAAEAVRRHIRESLEERLRDFERWERLGSLPPLTLPEDLHQLLPAIYGQ